VENETKPKGGRPGAERPKRAFNFYWIYGVIIVIILAIQIMQISGGAQQIKFND